MNNRSVRLAWSLLAMGVVAWLGVGIAVFALGTMRAARVEQEATMKTMTALQLQQLRTQTLARATEDDRARLESIASQDAAHMIHIIEAAGTDAGVVTHVGQAMSGAVSNSAVLHPASLIVEAEGPFPNVVRAAQLLGSLPVPSVVDSIELNRLDMLTASKVPTWRLAVTVRFLTSSIIPL